VHSIVFSLNLLGSHGVSFTREAFLFYARQRAEEILDCDLGDRGDNNHRAVAVDYVKFPS
jgi:hypothetical protein